MKFGFFQNGKLVDSCYAENRSLAASIIEHDEAHEILDANQLTVGFINTDDFTFTEHHAVFGRTCDGLK